MASVVVASGLAIYFISKKVHEKRETKRAMKAEEELRLQHNIDELAGLGIDGAPGHVNVEKLPGYERERLPTYHHIDQHSPLGTDRKAKKPLKQFW